MAEAEIVEDRTREDAGVARLVAGLRAAEPEACAEFCQRYGPRVHRFLGLRLRGDAALAEELMVQVLADAVRGISRFDPQRASLLAWLFGIARRQVLGELRRRGRRKSVPESAQTPLALLSEASLSEDPTEALAAQIAARQQVAALRAALSELEMEVLLLHGLHGLSVEEIGQVVGRSERAINSMLYRARRKARERLGGDE